MWVTGYTIYTEIEIRQSDSDPKHGTRLTNESNKEQGVSCVHAAVQSIIASTTGGTCWAI